MSIMKVYNKIAWACALTPALVGCVDEIDTTSNFTVDKPESVAQYDYLNAYQPLKSYIDRTAHPGFLLGTGVSADDYLKRGGVYVLTNSNFDQVTTGNAMKYASIVGDNGFMDFTKVNNFIDAATGAGLQVYGHTLCWHEQQNVKYLNGLIAPYVPDDLVSGGVETITLCSFYDGQGGTFGGWGGGKMESVDEDGKPCFKFSSTEVKENPWEIQACVSSSYETGVVYNIEFDVKGDPATFTWDFQKSDGYAGRGSTDPFDVIPAWTHVKIKGTPNGDGTDRMLLNLGKYEGVLFISNLVITYEGVKETEVPEAMITNGDGATDDNSCFFGKTSDSDPFPSDMEDHAFKVEINGSPAEEWSSQFFIKAKRKIASGEKMVFSMKVKCTDARTIDIQAHADNPGSYKGNGFVGNSFDTKPGEWIEYKWNGLNGNGDCDIIAFNLCKGKPADGATIWFKDIQWNVMVPGNQVERTDEEKREIIGAELKRWVEGCMEATDGKVKAWDVLNEVLSGDDKDGDGLYDLNSAKYWTNKPEERFFWADYLGKDFVRDLVKYARDSYKGEPSELKLFINDFNLESTRDNNRKVKDLVKWINHWEEDGVTKIDGIGSQMHVSYNMDATKQARQEECIVEMFHVLKASRKLVRITELDMGIVDENGNAVKTPDLTFEQKQKMSDFYKFIVKKYFEILDSDQQYGICQWAQTDSPEGSGWRPGEPIGLWDINYSRKPAYGGFADGLAGKE